jgi:ribosomal protein S18 acetylase RimI-like enzyme
MKLYFLKINKKDINSIYNLGKNNLQIYYDKNDINHSIISSDFASFKVEYNNNIVAFVICQKMNVDRLHINSFAVDKKYRRLGIGNFIIKKIKYMFNKYKFITLYVSVKNINALKLYFKNNFKIKNIKKNYYYNLNEDAYFMYYNNNDIIYYNLNNIIYNFIILFFILYYIIINYI